MSGRTVVGGKRVVSGAEKKAFDRGGPVWPPRSNAVDDRLGRVWGGFAPPAKIRGVWGAAPPSQNRKISKDMTTYEYDYSDIPLELTTALPKLLQNLISLILFGLCVGSICRFSFPKNNE